MTRLTPAASTADVAPWILTASGRDFPLLAPRAEDIHIDDIAHALSHLCRFTGHTRAFYSVAQHSVLVSSIVPPEHALAALLHDASEAYIGDVSTPLKAQLGGYAEIETRIMEQVLRAFDLPTEIPQTVKRADRILLATERRDLLPPGASPWPSLAGIECLGYPIVPLPPRAACLAFLERYRAVVAGRPS